MRGSPRIIVYVLLILIAVLSVVRIATYPIYVSNHVKSNGIDIVIPPEYIYDSRPYPILAFYTLEDDYITIKDMGTYSGSEEEKLKQARYDYIKNVSTFLERGNINVPELLNADPQFAVINNRKWLLMDTKVHNNIFEESTFRHI